MGTLCNSIHTNKNQKPSGNHSVDFKLSKIQINDDIIIEENTGSPIKAYKYIKNLGWGGFGKVYLVQHKMTDNYRAMKKMLKFNEEKVPQEVQILRKVSHPNIVKVHEYYYYSLNCVLIVSEYCQFGDLSSLNFSNLGEKQIAFIFYQILYSVLYLHSHNIIHRDLKDKNILVNEIDKQGNYFIKVIDFGLAKSDLHEKSDIAGTPHYIAPEIIKKEEYNEKCDLWSCGVLLYYMLVGELPFKGERNIDIFNSIIHGKISMNKKGWKKASETSKSLIKDLLQVDVKKRCSAAEALKHSWFKKLKIENIIKGIDQSLIIKYLRNLLEFKCTSKLQHAILSFIFHNMESCEEVKSAEKIFLLLDKKLQGKISKEKLKKYSNKYFPKSNYNVDEIFSELDSNGSGYLEYEEYLVGCLDKKTLINEKLLKFTFNHIDKYSTGKISVKNLVQFFHLNNQLDYTNTTDNVYILHGFNQEQELSFVDFKSIVSI